MSALYLTIQPSPSSTQGTDGATIYNVFCTVNHADSRLIAALEAERIGDGLEVQA